MWEALKLYVSGTGNHAGFIRMYGCVALEEQGDMVYGSATSVGSVKFIVHFTKQFA